MPAFRYTAIGRTGEVTRGVMDAASEAAVVERLRRAGSIPVRAEPDSGGSFLSGVLNAQFGRAGLSRQEVANMTRELAVMLTAGQDLDRAFRFLVETAPSTRARRVMERLRDAVRDGSPLASALAQFPRSFTRLYIGMIRAGESGGRLGPTLERLAEVLERQRSLAATVQSAMIYPALLLVAAMGSVVLMLTKVLPQFAPLFEQNGVQMPTSTRFLLAAGDAVSAYGLVALVLLVLLVIMARQMLARPGPRLWADRLLLRLPVIGPLAREIAAARFTRTLGTLLVNDVPLISALGTVRDVIGNSAAVGAVERATTSVRDGAGLSGRLAEASVFPVRTTYLLRLGEENAQLGLMALRAADIHEEKTRLGVQRLVSLLVPAITILMGAAVAGIVSSLLLAMLQLNDLAH